MALKDQIVTVIQTDFRFKGLTYVYNDHYRLHYSEPQCWKEKQFKYDSIVSKQNGQNLSW